jgi:hypothetical protein
MSRTFIRQDTQIRKSDVYDDSITPTLANYETNPVNIEDDLNSARSALQNFLNRNGPSFPAGNWYDDIAAPVTFENGAARGINETNQQLHDLERKRVLVSMANFTGTVTVPAAVFATGTLTTTANFGNGETVTTGSNTYTFQTVLTNVDGNVLIGVDATASLANLAAAINLGAGSGTVYAAATTANGFVSATSGASTLVATALLAGTVGNAIATTETAANASWATATLLGGVGDVKVLLIGELPSNTTAAIGVVTTRGTVAAFNTNFGNASLALVAGASAISPKNLCEVVDSVTRDPILSSNRIVYALFHTESNTDGSTMTGTTPNRAQLSFVRINGAGNALEAAPATDVAGKVIYYASVERKALEDLNEQDFLRGAAVDVPSSTTVTRQLGYDNQGTTPVELATNATLDLNSGGIAWVIRDLLNANIFRIVEGSGGGTTLVDFPVDVDTLNSDAAVNDFDKGIRVATGTTRINVGETAGVIETTGAADLRVLGAGELLLDDGNQTGSTWAQTTGIKLSDTTAEWNLFETNFGEVSLLNAINQAFNTNARKAKVYANVTANTSANTDVGGVAGGANLDAQLPDLSLGNFLTDYDVFLNGNLLRPGANSGSNHDYYPGTSLVNGQLKFEFNVKASGVPDVIAVVPYA